MGRFPSNIHFSYEYCTFLICSKIPLIVRQNIHSNNLFIQKIIWLFIQWKYLFFWKMPYRPPRALYLHLVGGWLSRCPFRIRQLLRCVTLGINWWLKKESLQRHNFETCDPLTHYHIPSSKLWLQGSFLWCLKERKKLFAKTQF